MAASSSSGSGVAACTSAIVTPPATKRDARTDIRRHSSGTRSRHNKAPIVTIKPAARSTGARGGYDSAEGCYLLQSLGPDSRNLFEFVHRGKLPVRLSVL